MPLLSNQANAVMLAVCFLFLLILLICSLLKKNKTMMSAPFITVCGAVALLQLTAFLEWLWKPGAYPILFFKILFELEYMLSYFCGAAFCWYVTTYLYAIAYPAEKKRPADEKKLIRNAFVLGVIALAIHVSSMGNGWLYSLTEAGTLSYTPAYLAVSLFGFIWSLITIVLLLRNRRSLPLQQLLLMVGHVLVPTGFFLTDLFTGMSLGCAVSALSFFLIYARIDNAQGERLLEQKALLMKQEAENAQIRMELMTSQIQPHFLYNSLSSIAFLCTEDPAEAEKATNEFSAYLKGNLQFIGVKTPIPFEIELKHVEQYLSIEKRRFFDRLRIEYDIQERDFRIPALTLQTLVENAVRYSVSSRYEPTTVKIVSEKTDTEYLVSIIDDGPGFDPDAKLPDDRRHIGLSGARYRLAEMVGGHLEINSVIGQGTTITIHIPRR